MKIYVVYSEFDEGKPIALFSDKENAIREANDTANEVAEMELDPPLTFPSGIKPFTVSCDENSRILGCHQHRCPVFTEETEVKDAGLTGNPHFLCVVMAGSDSEALARFAEKWRVYVESGSLKGFMDLFYHKVAVRDREWKTESLGGAVATISAIRKKNKLGSP